MKRPILRNRSQLVWACYSPNFQWECHKHQKRDSWACFIRFRRKGFTLTERMAKHYVKRCMVKLIKTERIGGTGQLQVKDADAFKGLPNLRGFFLDQTYEGDTAAREPGTLILSCRRNLWVATFKEPSQCAMLKLEGATLDEVWLTAEEFMASENAPWEHDPYEAQRRKGKRKT